ncbi:MAG TPA: hypothetical protein VKA41_09360 [Solirubrobacterales bacterium]|nr:hypothetical protein [Solirubrobacterales bacterium]
MKNRARRVALALICIALGPPAAAWGEQPDLLSFAKSSSMASNTTNVVNGQPQPGTLLLLNDQRLAVRSVPLGTVTGGETIAALSEVEVTNDVVTKQEDGTNVFHHIAAHLTLIVADSPTATSGIAVAQAQGTTVTPEVHHWTFEKSGTFTATQNLSGRYLNLVMWANSPENLTSCWTFPRSSLPNPQQPRACGMDVDHGRGHLSVMRTGSSRVAPATAVPFSVEDFSGPSVAETQPADIPTSYSGDPAQLIVAMARPIGELETGDILAVHSELEVDGRDVVRSDVSCNIGVQTKLFIGPSPTSLTGAVEIGSEGGNNLTGRGQRPIKTLERGVVPSSATYKASQDLSSQYVLLRAWTIGNSACKLFGNGIRAKLEQEHSYLRIARYRPEPPGDLVVKASTMGPGSELAPQLDLLTATPVTVYSQRVNDLLPGDRIEAFSEAQASTVNDRAAINSQLILADGPTTTSGVPLQPANFTEINPWMGSLPIHDSANWRVPVGVVGDMYVNLVMWGEALQSTVDPPDNSIAIAPDGGRLVVRQIRPVDSIVPNVSIASGPTGHISAAGAAFAFASSEPLTVTECKLDPGGDFQPCSSPKGYSGLADGPHAFSVRDTDRAGNTGPVASRSFTVDTRGPIVSITGGPGKKTKANRARISFSADEGGASFVCRVDRGPSRPCASPFTLKARRGRHTFQVWATDAVGNVGQPASRRWLVLKRKRA